MARAGGENFPVASRVLPRRVREHLLALYGFARLVDELGDDGSRPPAERLAALDWLEGEVERVYAGAAHHPLLVRLQGTVRVCALPREPFLRLIEANRVDQRVARYDTWAQLLGYCHLSADPVGELVLGVFGAATPERVARSDRICTALQLAEHWQDVAEDLRARPDLPAGRGPDALRLQRARSRPAGRGVAGQGPARLRGGAHARAAGGGGAADRHAARARARGGGGVREWGRRGAAGDRARGLRRAARTAAGGSCAARGGAGEDAGGAVAVSAVGARTRATVNAQGAPASALRALPVQIAGIAGRRL